MPDRHSRILAACLLAVFSTGPGAKAQERCETLVNTLGTFSTSAEFSLGGVGGLSVARYQSVGPRLILDEPKVISEIGAIAFSPLPLIVQVRPSLNDAPDPSKVIASYLLSHRQPPAFRYESVSPNLLLPAGTYFVLFVSQPNLYTEAGGMEGAISQTRGAQRASSFAAGSLNTVTGESRFSEAETAAVRVLGCRPPGPEPKRPDGTQGPRSLEEPAKIQVLPNLSGYRVLTGAPVTVAEQTGGVATATCASGKSVLGGGFQTSTPAGSSASPTLMNVYSSGVSGASAWSVSGFNGSTKMPSQSNKLTLTAYAICAFVQ